jgi:pimeloyl-ACP methyl ester carboxylesterase
LRDALPSEPDAIWVGHSAAGMLLPACARMLNAGGLVFVDASLPPATGTAAPVDAPFMEFVRGLPLDGDRLPAWSEWWGKDAIATLMPDPNERRQFDLELPRLKLAWFDDAVEVPDWRALRAGYVQTSRRFAHDAATARAHGWPVEVLDGTHLHPLLAPRETAAAIERAVKLAELR